MCVFDVPEIETMQHWSLSRAVDTSTYKLLSGLEVTIGQRSEVSEKKTILRPVISLLYVKSMTLTLELV